jgi:hypothetical protein
MHTQKRRIEIDCSCRTNKIFGTELCSLAVHVNVSFHFAEPSLSCWFIQPCYHWNSISKQEIQKLHYLQFMLQWNRNALFLIESARHVNCKFMLSSFRSTWTVLKIQFHGPNGFCHQRWSPYYSELLIKVWPQCPAFGIMYKLYATLSNLLHF